MEMSDTRGTFNGRSVDVSRGGIFAATTETRPVGTLLRVRVLGPRGDTVMAVGVIVLRVKEPDRARPFRVWGSPVTPLIAVVSCGYLMYKLPWVTWVRFGVWLAIGAVLYFSYGYRHSRLRRADGQAG